MILTYKQIIIWYIPKVCVFQLKNYKCAACGYSCYLKTDLERHLTNVHQKQRTPCPVCGKRYSDLRQHIRLVHEGHKVGSTNISIKTRASNEPS